MALGYLFILFVSIAIISGLIITLFYTSKNSITKNILFYILAIWSMGIAFINTTSLPDNYLLERCIALSFGFLAVIAIVIKTKKSESINISYLIVTLSTILGLIDLHFL